MHRVKSIEEQGHWRSGRHWGNDWTEVDDSEVTDKMRADLRLRVEQIVDETVPPQDTGLTDPFTPDEPLTEDDLADVEPEPEPEKPPLYVSDKPAAPRRAGGPRKRG